MDREIPKSEQRRAVRLRIMKVAAAVAAVAAAVWTVTGMAADTVDMKSLQISTADTGDIQASVPADGSIVAEHQEIIVSPIATRIMETYRNVGDTVEAGTPLLRLDLQAAETEYRKALDDEQMRRLQLEKLGVSQNTQLTDMKMRIKVARMALNSKQMQLQGERYLDSIGSGTTDRVRQAELDYSTAKLELEQLITQYENGRKAAEAERRVQQLDLQMFRKGLDETRRLLDDARIMSPRRAVITYIYDKVGARISQGEHVATVADLSTFKVECSIADGYRDRTAVGSRVQVRVGRNELSGTISSLNPQTKNGMMEFSVRLDNPSSPLLRPGLRAGIYVLTAERRGVTRIASGAFYNGPGKYRLFVKEGNSLVARDVMLGDANYDYIEVTGGVKPGDRVVVGDMERYKNKKKLRIKE